jgi:hypothetical protein
MSGRSEFFFLSSHCTKSLAFVHPAGSSPRF